MPAAAPAAPSTPAAAATPATPATPPAADPAAVTTPPVVEGEAPEETPPAVPAATPATPPAAAAALSAGQAYVDQFGAQGAMWFIAGKSLDECQALFAQQQRAELDATKAENADLKTKLAAFRGEANPLTFTAEPSAEQQKAALFAKQYGDTGQAKFAASIKLPAKK